jgi:phthalate 4,5-cis-dihydrodiol dehydrogenase
MTPQRLRIGVVGLGRAFTLMLPTFVADPRVVLVAAADPRRDATAQFAAAFGARAHESVESLCADPGIDVVYVATPHELHAAHVAAAAGERKHVLVEKPMAVTLDECRAMIDTVARAGVHMIVGHSHSFDRPVARTREIIASGAFGAVTMIHAQYYTDFLYRLRRPEELDTRRGGGVVFSQGAHQVDIVRLLAGGEATNVRALTGSWDPARPTEGAYAALLTFANGAFASLGYSGYGHFDGDSLCDGVSELGAAKTPADYGAARRRLAQYPDAHAEAAAKAARNFGGATEVAAPAASGGDGLAHQHFGLVVASCEHADLRLTPKGVLICRDTDMTFETLPPPRVPRVEVIDELYAAVVDGKAPLHDGRWGMATLEVCLAMLASARDGRDVVLHHQVAVPDGPRA